MKEKFLWIGMIVTFISWGFNYAYYHSQQLTQPIFLEHYYERHVNEEERLTFYYLTNKENPASVVSISIDGIEGINVYNDGYGAFMFDDTGSTYVQEFRHHYLKSVTVELPNDPLLMGDSASVIAFDEMEVFFNNQSSILADIGKVRLYPKDLTQSVFDFRMSSGSNQHRSEEEIVTKEPLTIEHIHIPFSDELVNEIAVKVSFNQGELSKIEEIRGGGKVPPWFKEDWHGKWEDIPGYSIEEKLFPIKLETNEWIGMQMFFNPERDSYFEFNIDIEGVTEAGIPFVYHSPIIDQPYLDQKAINRIIAEKEGDQ